MPQPSEDPVLRGARREAWVVLIISVAALIYTLVYCSLFGYGRAAASVTFVLGFPDWIFWGVILPWAVCLVLSCGFALWYMRDEDLGDDPSGAASLREGRPASRSESATPGEVRDD
jgi:hypothetical protein